MRARRFQNLSCGEPLDALVVGGGITGAPLYSELCRMGFRTAVVDKGDFSSGTSQASGMLIWGGLLYLKSLDFRTVRKLCLARNHLMKTFPEAISRLKFRLLNGDRPIGGMSPMMTLAGLHLYWLLGNCSLQRPSYERNREGEIFLGYEEGMLRESDSRFVIDQITRYQSEHALPINYCSVESADFQCDENFWHVILCDERTGISYKVRTRVLLNCGGVWTDEINRLIGVTSPWKHAFSKGVYLALPRRGDRKNECAAIYPMPGQEDVLTHVPWGPVMMWGPTETAASELGSALAPNKEDVQFLLKTASQCLKRRVGPEEVVSLRCGVRPLAVPVNYRGDRYPLELSRRHQIVAQHGRRTIAAYGGKLTSSFLLAVEVCEIVKQWLPLPRFANKVHRGEAEESGSSIGEVYFPEFDRAFVSPEWAREQELCVTMEDYLRRRTPLAQWIPRMGWGRGETPHPFLKDLAESFATSADSANDLLEAYATQIKERYDPLFSL